MTSIIPFFPVKGGLVLHSISMQTPGSSVDNIVRKVLRSTLKWNRVAYYVRGFLLAKKIEFDRNVIFFEKTFHSSKEKGAKYYPLLAR